MSSGNKNKVINRLALVLISLVVLELVLIGDQVQPVKAIKRKIYLKKLKKLLPLFALVKPKKKIILLPIPIPIFKSHPSMMNHQTVARPTYHQTQGPLGSRPATMVMPTTSYPMGGQMQAPMSFIMMDNEASSFMVPPAALPMTMSSSNNIEPFVSEPTTTTTTTPTPASPAAGNTSAGPESPLTLMGPSMTMTIQSEPGGGSNIELSTNLMNGQQSGALIQQRPYRWGASKQQQQWNSHNSNRLPQQLQLNDNFDEPAASLSDAGPGGEQYYSSPWTQGGRLASPAKLLRVPKPQLQQQQNWQARPVHHQQPQLVSLQNQPSLPPIQHQPTAPNVVRQVQLPANQQVAPWRTAPPAQFNWQREPARLQQQQQQQLQLQQQQQQISQALEQEELLAVGPPQEMPVYQAPNGQLHISLPPAPPINGRPGGQVSQIEQESEQLKLVQQHNVAVDAADQGGADEVQTLPAGSRGQGQQQQQQHQHHPESVRIHTTTTTTSRPSGQLQQAYIGQRPPPTNQPSKTSGRLVSPAVKGKQQQLQLTTTNNNNKGTTGNKAAIVAGGY